MSCRQIEESAASTKPSERTPGLPQSISGPNGLINDIVPNLGLLKQFWDSRVRQLDRVCLLHLLQCRMMLKWKMETPSIWYESASRIFSIPQWRWGEGWRSDYVRVSRSTKMELTTTDPGQASWRMLPFPLQLPCPQSDGFTYIKLTPSPRPYTNWLTRISMWRSQKVKIENSTEQMWCSPTLGHHAKLLKES